MKIQKHIISLHEQMANLTDRPHIFEYLKTQKNSHSIKEHYMITLFDLWKLSQLSEKEFNNKYSIFIESYYSARDFFEEFNEKTALYTYHQTILKLKS